MHHHRRATRLLTTVVTTILFVPDVPLYAGETHQEAAAQITFVSGAAAISSFSGD